MAWPVARRMPWSRSIIWPGQGTPSNVSSRTGTARLRSHDGRPRQRGLSRGDGSREGQGTVIWLARLAVVHPRRVAAAWLTVGTLPVLLQGPARAIERQGRTLAAGLRRLPDARPARRRDPGPCRPKRPDYQAPRRRLAQRGPDRLGLEIGLEPDAAVLAADARRL